MTRSAFMLAACGFMVSCGETTPSAPETTTAPDPESPNLFCYRSVSKIEDAASALAATHSTVGLEGIGSSWERSTGLGVGHDIVALRITRPAGQHPKPPVLLVGGLHGGELGAPELLLRFAEHLAGQYEIDPDVTWLVDHTDLAVVPLANPDARSRVPENPVFPGAAYTWPRKNLNWVAASCEDPAHSGIDLNRNFDSDWVAGENACWPTFSGLEAGSEPETQAITEYARMLFSNRDVGAGFYVDVHTTPLPLDTLGRLVRVQRTANGILRPFGHDLRPEASLLEMLGRKVARLAGGTSWRGFDYLEEFLVELWERGVFKTPAPPAASPAFGLSMDFMHREFGQLPALSFEMGSIAVEDCGVFEETMVPRYTNALIYLLKAARNAYRLAEGPEVSRLEAALIGTEGSGGFVSVGDLATLRVRASGFHGIGDVDSLARVAYSVGDLPPTLGSTDTFDMISLDGAIDGGEEELEAIVDLRSVPIGRNLVFVHAVDADGDWGVVSAAWLDNPGITVTGRAFEFTGRVTSVEVPDSYPVDSVLPGYAFSDGDTFRGFFAFDPNAQDYWVEPDPTRSVQSAFAQAITAAGVAFDGGWAGSGAVRRYGPFGSDGIEIFNEIAGQVSPDVDRYWVKTSMVNGPNLIRIDRKLPPDFRTPHPAGVPIYMGIVLTDSNGNALASAELPMDPPPLGAFETREFYLGFGRPDRLSEPMWVRGVIESLTVAGFPTLTSGRQHAF